MDKYNKNNPYNFIEEDFNEDIFANYENQDFEKYNYQDEDDIPSFDATNFLNFENQEFANEEQNNPENIVDALTEQIDRVQSETDELVENIRSRINLGVQDFEATIENLEKSNSHLSVFSFSYDKELAHRENPIKYYLYCTLIVFFSVLSLTIINSFFSKYWGNTFVLILAILLSLVFGYTLTKITIFFYRVLFKR